MPAMTSRMSSLGGLRGAGSIRAGSAIPSDTRRWTARDSRSAVHGGRGEPSGPSARAALPHECAGRIARTLGIQASRVASSSAMYCRSRRAESLRIASGSRRRRLGLPPTRPRALAAINPALVRSRIRARSSSAAAPSTWRANLPCGVEVSIGSRSDLKVPAHRPGQLGARPVGARRLLLEDDLAAGGAEVVELAEGRLILGRDAGVADQGHGSRALLFRPWAGIAPPSDNQPINGRIKSLGKGLVGIHRSGLL